MLYTVCLLHYLGGSKLVAVIGINNNKFFVHLSVKNSDFFELLTLMIT